MRGVNEILVFYLVLLNHQHPHQRLLRPTERRVGRDGVCGTSFVSLDSLARVRRVVDVAEVERLRAGVAEVAGPVEVDAAAAMAALAAASPKEAPGVASR